MVATPSSVESIDQRAKKWVLVDKADLGYFKRRVVRIHAVLDWLKFRL